MNFAAQFFYSNFRNERSPRRVGFSNSEEYDPFWQRWDTATPDYSGLSSEPSVPDSSSPTAHPSQPFPAPAVIPLPQATMETLPSPSVIPLCQDSVKTLPSPSVPPLRQDSVKTLPSPSVIPLRQDSVKTLPSPSAPPLRQDAVKILPSPSVIPLCQDSVKTLPSPSVIPLCQDSVKTLPSPSVIPQRQDSVKTLPSPSVIPMRQDSVKTLPSPSVIPLRQDSVKTLPSPSVIPLRQDSVKTLLSPSVIPLRQDSVKTPPSPSVLPLRQDSVKTLLSPSVIPACQATMETLPSHLDKLSCLEPHFILPAFHTLVGLLLRLALYFMLLFICSEGDHMEANQQETPQSDGMHHKDGPVTNGCLAQRPVPIHPERLMDFGEEEYLNGGVNTWEMKVLECPEPQLKSSPKLVKRKGNDTKVASKSMLELLHIEDISTAALKIQSCLPKTPCTYSRLSKKYGMEIFLKKEQLQYTGSAKERGVLNLLTSLKQEQQKKGVIVATDRNFSMAVAHHAAKLRIPVFVIMPANSSQSGLRKYRDYGAMVISFGSTVHDTLSHARHLAKENNYLYLEEDDSAIYLAGLGTIGMEIYEQVPKLDAVIVPADGHCALLAGTASALKHLDPCISVIGVEYQDCPLLIQPINNDYLSKDFRTAPNKKLYGDLVDPPLGNHAFQLAKKLVDKTVSVREEDILVAMLRFQEYEKSMVDPEGALGLAAILAGKLPELKGKRVAVVVSSANMEFSLVRQCVERALVVDAQVSKFTVQLEDGPQDMAKLMDLLARENVRLLDVCLRTDNGRTYLFHSQVECVVETRDKTQSIQLRSRLSELYPNLHWLE